MICPEDMTQMNQKDRIGGGDASDDIYRTWELKECPYCGRLVIEYYCARPVESVDEARKIMAEEPV